MTNEVKELTFMFKVKVYPNGAVFPSKPWQVGKERFIKTAKPKKEAKQVELGDEVLL